MPVAIRLRLFDIVAKASRDGPLSLIAILAAYRKEIKPVLILIVSIPTALRPSTLRLLTTVLNAEDILLAMAGLVFVDRVDEDMYQANEIRSTLKRLPQPNMDLYCCIASIAGITMRKWNSTGDDNPQSVKGALVYHMQNVMHALPDLEAARLLQEIAESMALYSRWSIHGLPKILNMVGAHTAMVLFFGGRQRGQTDWEQMAAVAGLRVTFQVYPEFGEGVVEMRKT
ncbi:hypothetical protein AnigIFM56816_007723 [Aspergillus niger]|nr:hypothetical protein AnigIFM56816_007723 [Aspergillus niger]